VSSPTGNNPIDSAKVVDTVHAVPAVVPYVWPDISAIVPGMTRQLRLETFSASTGLLLPSDTATWTTSNAAVSTVDQSGLVTAIVTGHAIITATHNGKTMNADVFVFAYPAPLRFASISLGTTHVCGVTLDHAAYCWGSNDNNQLGIIATMDDCELITVGDPQHFLWTRSVYPCSAVPRQVVLPEASVDVQAGVLGACSITTTNAVYCWGTGYGLTQNLPKLLPGANFRAVSLGAAQACGIGLDSLAYCWGTGFLGSSATGPTFSPTAVANNKPWSAISSRTDSNCALDATGVPYCWGSAPVAATLGQTNQQCPNLPCGLVPTAVVASSGSASARFTQIVATGSNNCALTADGKLYCWGGDETRAIAIEPATSQPANGLVSIAAGIDQGPGHTRPICGLTSGGASYCWTYSRSASADSAFALAPYAVGVALRSIAHRESAACGLGVDGFAYCWGTGFDGSAILGDGKFGEYRPAMSPAKVIGQ
jgi:hypothetical protein